MKKLVKTLFLHDCAGVALELRKQLIARGHECDLFFFGRDPYIQYGAMTFNPVRLRNIRIVAFVFNKIMGDYDIIHTYNSRFPNHRYPYDYLFAKFLGKNVVVHFHGSDLRLRSHTPVVQRLMKNKVCIVSTPDLLEYCPNATWLPNPVPSEMFHPVPQEEHEEIRILHSSTMPEIKGTKYVLESIKELRGKGYDIDLRVAGVPPYGTTYPRVEMPKLFNWCDLVVNEVLLPVHSLVGVEGMLCEKPVLSSYKIDRKISDPPIFDISKETLTDDIQTAIDHLDEYKKHAKSGREWAIKYHDPDNVTDKLLTLYAEAVE